MPTYEVKAPDGHRYRVSGPGSEQEALAQVQAQVGQQSQNVTPEAPKASLGQRLLDSLNPIAGAERSMAMISGTAANIGSGYAGLAAGAGEAGDEARARFQDRFTYQPRTEAGKRYMADIGEGAAMLDRGADWIGEQVPGGPGVQAGVKTALLGALSLIGPKGVGGVKPGAVRPTVAPRAAAGVHPAVANARGLGMSLDPRQVVNGKPVGSALQRGAAVVGGKHAIPADASLLNQNIVRRMVADEIGAPANETITSATIGNLKAPENAAYSALENLTNKAGQPYRVNLARDSQYIGATRKVVADATTGVSRIPDPAIVNLVQEYRPTGSGIEVRNVMKDIRELRFRASKNFKSDDPAIVQKARAERGIADALEDALDRQVKAPGVIDRWREARVKLAKLNTVEDALVGTEIDARLLHKYRESGGKLSGNLEKLADVARDFPTVMQTGASLGSKSGLGLLDAASMGTGATIGAAVAGPPGALLGGLAWPAARYAGKRVALRPGAGVRKP